MNIEGLVKSMEDLNSLVQHFLTTEREQMRKMRSKDELAIFSEGDYVLVNRDNLNESEKLCLR